MLFRSEGGAKKKGKKLKRRKSVFSLRGDRQKFHQEKKSGIPIFILGLPSDQGNFQKLELLFSGQSRYEYTKREEEPRLQTLGFGWKSVVLGG